MNIFVIQIKITSKKIRYKNEKLGWEIRIWCPPSQHLDFVSRIIKTIYIVTDNE